MVITVECIGMVPPCKRCKKLEENALRAAKRLEAEGVEVVVLKKDIMSEEVSEKYGVLMSPALIINGVVKYNGKLPDHRVVERRIREAI